MKLMCSLPTLEIFITTYEDHCLKRCDPLFLFNCIKKSRTFVLLVNIKNTISESYIIQSG